MLMIYSCEIDLRILFKNFYCPICGKKLEIIKEVNKLTDEQKKIYYKQLYPSGVPINLEVGKVKQMFMCYNCNYYNSTDNQLLIRKKQKLLKKKVLDDTDL